MRKVNVTVRPIIELVLVMDEGIEVSDVINNLDFEASIDRNEFGVDVEDCLVQGIEDHQVTDSR